MQILRQENTSREFEIVFLTIDFLNHFYEYDTA